MQLNIKRPSAIMMLMVTTFRTGNVVKVFFFKLLFGNFTVT